MLYEASGWLPSSLAASFAALAVASAKPALQDNLITFEGQEPRLLVIPGGMGARNSACLSEGEDM